MIYCLGGGGGTKIQFNHEYIISIESMKKSLLHFSVLNMTNEKRTEKINFTVNKVQFFLNKSYQKL